MLGKLIKHELRGSGRTMLPFILVSLFLSVMMGFSMRAMESQQDYGWLTVVFGFVVFLFVAGLMAVCIMSVVVVINRFRRNLLGDEGYLMFTLPVSVDAHIFSKLIVSFIWFIATFLTCVLAFVLMMACNIDQFDIDWSELSYMFSELGRVIGDFGVMHVVGYVLEMLLLFFVASCNTCLFFYCAMAIGYSFANRKMLMSIVAFFGLNFLFSMLQTVGITLVGRLDLQFHLDTSMLASMHVALLSLSLYVLLANVLLYVPTRLLLKKKLNLP